MLQPLQIRGVSHAYDFFKGRNDPGIIHEAVIRGNLAAFLAAAGFHYNLVAYGILHTVRVKIIHLAHFLKADADDFCFIAHKFPPSTAERFAQIQLWTSSGIQFCSRASFPRDNISMDFTA